MSAQNQQDVRDEQDAARKNAPETTPATAAPGGRLVTGIAWVVLLLGLWLWGGGGPARGGGGARAGGGERPSPPPPQ
ncbi:hypothetical protein ACFXA8_18370, partial [Streptomyces sp. NPDC059409]